MCDNVPEKSLENLPDEVPCWWEEIISTKRLRLAAGICVLAAGLFIGSAGGAIAWADTESTVDPVHRFACPDPGCS